MASILRYRVRWSGWSGGPGLSTFYSALTDAPAFATGVAALLNTAMGAPISSLLGKNVTLIFDPFAEVIDSATGDLISTTGLTAPTTITSSNTATFAASAGACVTWVTDGIAAGRRVRGRTFFVPLNSTAYQDDGTLADAKKTQIQGAVDAYAAGAFEACIWHRPTAIGTDGSAHPITSGVVRDKAAVLRSRRD